MRTSSLLLAAAVGAVGMGAAYGQTVSANVVGYINLDLPKGLTLIANQLDNKNGNKLADVIASAPDGTFLHKFNGSGYTSATYFTPAWEGAGNITLAPGEGAFIEIPQDAAATSKITFVGEVLQGAASNHSVPTGLQILSHKVPQAGKISTDLKFPTAASNAGSFLYKWVNSKKDYDIFSNFEGWEAPAGEPSVAVGEAFFSLNPNPAPTAWDRNFTVPN